MRGINTIFTIKTNVDLNNPLARLSAVNGDYAYDPCNYGPDAYQDIFVAIPFKYAGSPESIVGAINGLFSGRTFWVEDAAGQLLRRINEKISEKD